MDLFGDSFGIAHAITIIGTYTVTAVSLFKLLSHKRNEKSNTYSYAGGNKCVDVIELNTRTINHEAVIKEHKRDCDKNREELLTSMDNLRNQHREDIKNLYVEMREIYEIVIARLSGLDKVK